MNEKLHPAQLLFTENHPLTASLNMKFLPETDEGLCVEINAPRSFAEAGSNEVHTGFNTLLLDTVTGSCAIGKLEKMQPIATIKLNCNHMRKARVGEKLACTARWQGEKHGVSYVTGDIVSREDNDTIATSTASFMVGTASRPLDEKR